MNKRNVFENIRIVIDQDFYRKSIVREDLESMGIIIKVLRAVNWGLAHEQVIFDQQDLYKHAGMCRGDISEAIAWGLLQHETNLELAEEEDIFSVAYPNGLFRIEDVS